MADAPSPALPSATILLLRDGIRGLEVFMVQRHHQIDFATGAMVFPGGKVDPGDTDPTLAPRCDGLGAAGDEQRALRVAAIRETFEEAGVLLARPDAGDSLVCGTRLAALRRRWRDALNANQADMPQLVAQEGLRLACDLLVPFAHWITPAFMPKRFDTWFFLVPAPEGQLAVHDGGESVDSLWIRPEDAVAEAEAGRRTIIFPTLMNVKKLGRSRSVAEALRAARSRPVVTVFPRIEERGGEMRMILPAEADYDVVEAPLDALR
jgi:8-oxo-dGTP pyrophosphatase MutT (NUDIX family)